MKDKKDTFSLKKLIILVTILALPGFCYYLLQEKGQNRYKSLPFYGEKKLTGTYHSKRGNKIPDTLYHTVPPFTLTDVHGVAVHFGPDSTIAVVSLWSTKNKDLAEGISRSMQRVASNFERNGMVALYSISIDSLTLASGVVEAYSALWGKYRYWNWLLDLEPTKIRTLARTGFLLDVVANPQTGGIATYSSSIVLLDSQRRIRGYYDALVKEDVDKLIDEIKLLLTEEFRNISIKSNND